ncbi:MAG: CvpA family protein [Oscillospiraceae bacterium]|jgi:hypothetical protein|nr:CvpA family protein [Oscillospiraceae bacterium]
MRFIFDAVLLIILLFCIWNGYKKGLVMCIGTILSIIISLYVGDLMGDIFSTEMKPVLRPFLSGYMDGTEGVISESLDTVLGAGGAGLSIDDAIERNPQIRQALCVNSYKSVGVYGSAAERMAERAVTLSEESGVTLSYAIVDGACQAMAYVMIFLLFFLLSVIILTVIGNLFNLSFKIPGQEKLNIIGGAAAGGVTGILLCMLLVWALRFCGIFLPESEMTRTLLTALFLKLNFMPLILML